MDTREKIRKKIEKELKYFRIQNIRILQEVRELEDIVKHNRSRFERIEIDRKRSEDLVNKLREEVINGEKRH